MLTPWIKSEFFGEVISESSEGPGAPRRFKGKEGPLGRFLQAEFGHGALPHVLLEVRIESGGVHPPGVDPAPAQFPALQAFHEAGRRVEEKLPLGFIEAAGDPDGPQFDLHISAGFADGVGLFDFDFVLGHFHYFILLFGGRKGRAAVEGKWDSPVPGAKPA